MHTKTAHICWVSSPLGPLALTETDGAITALDFAPEMAPVLPPRAPGEPYSPWPVLDEAARQLAEYFAGQRTAFALPLAPQGTAFQRAVWAAMAEIPYGQTATYGQLAAAVGKPRASRAVGGACHNNPVPILLPCHRVVGAGGALTGYAGGLEIKRFLLALEAQHRA